MLARRLAVAAVAAGLVASLSSVGIAAPAKTKNPTHSMSMAGHKCKAGKPVPKGYMCKSGKLVKG